MTSRWAPAARRAMPAAAVLLLLSRYLPWAGGHAGTVDLSASGESFPLIGPITLVLALACLLITPYASWPTGELGL